MPCSSTTGCMVASRLRFLGLLVCRRCPSSAMVLLVVAVANGKMVQLPDQSLFHGHVLQSLGNLSICQRDHRQMKWILVRSSFFFFILFLFLACSAAGMLPIRLDVRVWLQPYLTSSTLLFCLPTPFTGISIFGGNWCLASCACSRFD